MRAESRFSGGIHLASFCPDKADAFPAVSFWVVGTACGGGSGNGGSWRRRGRRRKHTELQYQSRRRQPLGHSFVRSLGIGGASPEQTGMGTDSTIFGMDCAGNGVATGGIAFVDLQRLRLSVHSLGCGGDRTVPVARGVATVERGRTAVFCVGRCVWIRGLRFGGGGRGSAGVACLSRRVV